MEQFCLKAVKGADQGMLSTLTEKLEGEGRREEPAPANRWR